VGTRRVLITHSPVPERIVDDNGAHHCKIRRLDRGTAEDRAEKIRLALGW
jgi:hypothetical protein